MSRTCPTCSAEVEGFHCCAGSPEAAAAPHVDPVATWRTLAARLAEALRKVGQYDCHPSNDRHSDGCKERRKLLKEYDAAVGRGART